MAQDGQDSRQDVREQPPSDSKAPQSPGCVPAREVGTAPRLRSRIVPQVPLGNNRSSTLSHNSAGNSAGTKPPQSGPISGFSSDVVAEVAGAGSRRIFRQASLEDMPTGSDVSEDHVPLGEEVLTPATSRNMSPRLRYRSPKLDEENNVAGVAIAVVFAILALTVCSTAPYVAMSLVVFLAAAWAVLQSHSLQLMQCCCAWQAGEAPINRQEIQQRLAELQEGAVLLHVYDLGHSSFLQMLNGLLMRGKVGGIFHGGVEVLGSEWGYGYVDSGTGVYSIPPKSNADHTYRLTCPVGRTPLSGEQVQAVLDRMSEEWKGPSFDAIRHNCLDFCMALCKELRVGPAPSWLGRATRIAAFVFVAEGDCDSSSHRLAHDEDELAESTEGADMDLAKEVANGAF